MVNCEALRREPVEALTDHYLSLTLTLSVNFFYAKISLFQPKEYIMDKNSPWYIGQSKLGAGYQHFSNTAKQDTVLDSKTKELIRLAVASVFRCKHCTEHHLQDALAAGASKAEVSEALLLASLQSAGTQLNWNRELFEKYLDNV